MPMRRSYERKVTRRPQIVPQSLDGLLAEVLFGIYWHKEFFRTLPPELESWRLSLSN